MKDETIENKTLKSLKVRNLEIPDSMFEERSMMSMSHNQFEEISIDFSKAPNFIYIDQLNQENFNDRLKEISWKIGESFSDLMLYYLNFFSGNLKLFFIFILMCLIYHFFAGKF
jgi:hypothetical protein